MSIMRNILLKSFILFCLAVSAIGCRQPEPLMPKSSAAAGIPAGFVAVFGKTGADPIVVCGNRTLAEHRFPPCSTFKIVSTLMGLDSGVLTGPESRLGYDGTRYEFAAWNGDLTLREAFRTSCVPYYKKLTGKLDRRTVQKTLDRLNYGNCDISVWNSNGHNVFWIESSLLISPLEQLGVLEKIFSGRSGFAPGHVELLRECMRDGCAGDWTLYGKTGSGRNHNTNRLEGWFVGFAEPADGKPVFFAAHGAAPDRDVNGPEMRQWLREQFSRGFLPPVEPVR